MNAVWIVAALAGGCIFGYLVCVAVAKATGSRVAAENEKLKRDAQKEADQILREACVTAKADVVKLKEAFEDEVRDRRREQLSAEKRLAQKEENITRKEDSLDAKVRNIEKKEHDLEAAKERLANKDEELKKLIANQVTELERISGMDRETAKGLILEKLKGEVENECGILIRNTLDEAKQRAERESQKLMISAIQRYAGDCTYERTTATIPLPNDEMKGRIIGREGRNIRAIETLTGVDLIIDDTPEAITLSCFDPVRREIARIALEKLISDGRIHPTRIEDMVEKARREVEASIKQAGEKATFETGIHGLNSELVRLLGRLKYRTSYGQNVLNHSIEVSLLSGIIANELGVDSTLAKRAGLLHDIGKALTQEVEGSHVEIGVEVARKYKESREIIHAIEAHHGDVEPQTITAVIVQAADAISAARPGARRENLENYIKRLAKLEEIAGSFNGVEKTFAIQAGREIRIMVKPEVISDEGMKLVARDIVKKIESELEYPGQIKVNLIRESRAVDYAK